MKLQPEEFTVKETKKLITLSFTYSQFVDFAQNRKQHDTVSYIESRETNSDKNPWSGTNNIDQAFEMARGGWDTGIKQMELDGGVLADSGTTFTPNVVGSVVNMQNYLQGLPDNMYEMKIEREYNLPLLTLYIPLSYSAYNGIDDALAFAKNITKIVNEKQSTHNVKLVGFFYTVHDSKDMMTEVLIKDHDERFVLNNVAYAFHPSFFRRLWFSHLEAQPFHDSSYGRNKEQGAISRYWKKHHERGTAYLVPQLNDLSKGKFGEKDLTLIAK